MVIQGHRPSATTFDVEDLVGMAWRGEIRIPHFQRDFRWGWEDARRFFDSILRGYPVGNLLLWAKAAPAGNVRLGALEIEAPEYQAGYWVVDGQQRLTTLANVLSPAGHKDPRFSISYNLRSEELVRPTTGYEGHVVPLHILFNLQELLKWFSADQQLGDYLDRATAITRALRQFEIPAYLVQEEDVTILQDIFDRMNNYGKRLTRSEVFAALNAPDGQTDSLTFEGIAAQIDADLSFGPIDSNTILASILSRRGPDVRREIRTEFASKSDEGRDAAYSSGAKALRRAVSFLQENVGIPHVSFLPYQYLLVVLSRFFSYEGEVSDRDLSLLARWFWQAALVGPENFRGGTPNAAYLLCNRIDLGDPSKSVQQLLDAVSPPRPQTVDLRRFAVPHASTKILLTALWALAPRSPLTGEPITREELAGAIGDQTASAAISYLVPRQQLPGPMRPWAANRVISPESGSAVAAVAAALTTPVESWGQGKYDAFLRSHLLEQKYGDLLRNGQLEEMVKERQAAMQAYLDDFLHERALSDRDASPPIASLIVDDEDVDSPNELATTE